MPQTILLKKLFVIPKAFFLGAESNHFVNILFYINASTDTHCLCIKNLQRNIILSITLNLLRKNLITKKLEPKIGLPGLYFCNAFQKNARYLLKIHLSLNSATNLFNFLEELLIDFLLSLNSLDRYLNSCFILKIKLLLLFLGFIFLSYFKSFFSTIFIEFLKIILKLNFLY